MENQKMDQSGEVLTCKFDDLIVSSDSDGNSEDVKKNNEQSQDVREMNKFYLDAKEYWSKVQPTIEGMLGGFAHISNVDIKGSLQFLKDLLRMKPSPETTYALDCGAGIGRITKYLLTQRFENVDIVEQDVNFSKNAKSFVDNCKLVCVFNKGLQDFAPEPKKYDVIWCQWVLGHLTNKDLVDFLCRCSKGLRRNGVIVIKENISSNESGDVDTADSSVTRPLKAFQDIIKSANFRVIKMAKQTGFPKGLYSVYMIAIKPVYQIERKLK